MICSPRPLLFRHSAPCSDAFLRSAFREELEARNPSKTQCKNKIPTFFPTVGVICSLVRILRRKILRCLKHVLCHNCDDMFSTSSVAQHRHQCEVGAPLNTTPPLEMTAGLSIPPTSTWTLTHSLLSEAVLWFRRTGCIHISPMCKSSEKRAARSHASIWVWRARHPYRCLPAIW